LAKPEVCKKKSCKKTSMLDRTLTTPIFSIEFIEFAIGPLNKKELGVYYRVFCC